jgi:mannose/fructose/N-acetylgalactosamine-specific phosphotransferase system component IID
MQNLGFVYAMIPTIRHLAMDSVARSRMLTRHLQLFNTHPGMSGPIFGSAIRLEENLYSNGDCPDVDHLKTTLMAPYAAMGDALFWGSLKPFAGVVGVMLALSGFLSAGLVLLLLYNPLHGWIRLKGFLEGYRKGKEGVEFIRSLNVPRISRVIRWMSVLLLGFLSASVSLQALVNVSGGLAILGKACFLVMILVCWWMMKRGISVMSILYGASLLLFTLGLVWTW